MTDKERLLLGPNGSDYKYVVEKVELVGSLFRGKYFESVPNDFMDRLVHALKFMDRLLMQYGERDSARIRAIEERDALSDKFVSIEDKLKTVEQQRYDLSVECAELRRFKQKHTDTVEMVKSAIREAKKQTRRPAKKKARKK